MGVRRLRVRSRRSRDSPVSTQCNQTECFDPLVRNCVSCELFYTPETRHGKQRHGDRRDLSRGLQPTRRAPLLTLEPSLENVFVPPSETLHASAPNWPPFKEDADNILSCHSIPVPATELGSTELVTTKTAGPEQ
ncbi:rCG60144 [Rattus norvegicus]|uniref:RCG60144 n=1 Tax=Rattus norvegicus TaxID=10116 RepID=A6HT50_RAT|nr:rCG60144 [Rattus norvegicus]